MERRRGDSYLGKEFSEPSGLPEDVHVRKKLGCVDCHQTGPGGMGHIERKATCQDCHIEVEQAMAASVHKNVTCEACHVKILGGYEMTSWGPGMIESRPNPFKKYSLYYGPQGPPILIKDQKGIWIPTKIWPNSVGGIKENIAAKPGLTFRWPKGETHDAYALLGTFAFPGGNNNYLAWIQVEQVAHPLGKSRTCRGCHDSTEQVSSVTWRYFDAQGAEPFTGSQKVVADKNGIHVKDIKATSKIELMKDGKIENFAAWLRLGDIWKTSGDFSIPKSDPAKYRNLDKGIRDALARLDVIDRKLKAREAKGEDVKKLRRRWKEARAAAVHEPGSARELLAETSQLVIK
ncbi:MAG: cytochrome c3 family protein [Nitrospirota bacterium]|nr:cytochrome c3 family protein [Nitrospirota bacterium]